MSVNASRFSMPSSVVSVDRRGGSGKDIDYAGGHTGNRAAADTTAVAATGAASGTPVAAIALFGGALVFLAAAMVLAILGYTVAGLKRERSFDLLMVLGTMVLPSLPLFRSLSWAGPCRPMPRRWPPSPPPICCD